MEKKMEHEMETGITMGHIRSRLWDLGSRLWYTGSLNLYPLNPKP